MNQSMIKYIRIVLGSSLLMLGTSGCSDLFVTEPKQSVSSNLALQDITGIRSLVISIYDRLQPNTYYGARMMIGPDILADNVRLTNSNSNRYFNERVNAAGAHLQQIWDQCYPGINEANFVIAGIDGSNASQDEKNQLKGEAYFLRGLMYFDLARVFAYEPTKTIKNFNLGLIVRTEPTNDVSQADFRERSTNEQTYQQIESDLKAAISLLPTSATAERRRANKSAAQALLARLYLYWEKYPEAVQAATEAMASTGARLVTGAQYQAAFTTTIPNPESLFEINYVQATESLGSNESLHSLTTNLTTGNWGDVVPTTELLNLYEPTDVRRTAMFYAATKGGEAVFFSRKYTATQGAFTSNVPVIRYSEVLLIRAEAYAASGDATRALADLNQIRARSGATTIASSISGQALIDAIMTERRLELVLEGHRFFDLKRRAMTITKASLSAPVPYDDFRILAPLPIGQVQLNTRLRQNPGY
jgi:tetratricopeptide (TPR) repeat protein